eukprot:363873-Chlamydomonas_euryale.AAC.16
MGQGQRRGDVMWPAGIRLSRRAGDRRADGKVRRRGPGESAGPAPRRGWLEHVHGVRHAVQNTKRRHSRFLAAHGWEHMRAWQRTRVPGSTPAVLRGPASTPLTNGASLKHCEGEVRTLHGCSRAGSCAVAATRTGACGRACAALSARVPWSECTCAASLPAPAASAAVAYHSAS